MLEVEDFGEGNCGEEIVGFLYPSSTRLVDDMGCNYDADGESDEVKGKVSVSVESDHKEMVLNQHADPNVCNLGVTSADTKYLVKFFMESDFTDSDVENDCNLMN